jgi:hypothetical protein
MRVLDSLRFAQMTEERTARSQSRGDDYGVATMEQKKARQIQNSPGASSAGANAEHQIALLMPAKRRY